MELAPAVTPLCMAALLARVRASLAHRAACRGAEQVWKVEDGASNKREILELRFADPTCPAGQ